MRAINLNNIISQARAARIRSVDRAAIADLIKRGRLRTINVGGVPYLFADEVKNFEKQKPGPKPKRKKGNRL